jgi:geranylgeranyl diphosphate synthase type II
MSNFATDFEDYKKLINQSVYNYVDKLKIRANNIDSQYGVLWESIDKLLRAGGKRFRPYMSILTYKAFSEESIDNIIDSVSAQELLHLALLVHDDIIDRDYIRYGIDNVSGQYFKLYEDHIHDPTDRRHFSDSAAILAGDLLISSSYQMLILSAPNEYREELINIYDETIYLVAAGELLDTESAFYKSNSEKSIHVAELKTAHYSFVTPLLVGAVLAGANEDTKNKIRNLGTAMGTAYQLVDDEIGIFGDENITGKSNLSDLAEGKQTYLINEFFKTADNNQLEIFKRYFGKKDLNEEQAAKLREILINSGARQKNIDRIKSLTAESNEIIDSLNLKDESKNIFRYLLEITINRNK